MSKPTIIPLKLTNLIQELTFLWLRWMQHHNACNNVSLSLNERRLNGEECEHLQKRRQQILIEMNDGFSEIIDK